MPKECGNRVATLAMTHQQWKLGEALHMLDLNSAVFFTSFEASSWLQVIPEAWASLSAWSRAQYAEAPALVLGVAVALAIPAIAVLGTVSRQVLRKRQQTDVHIDAPTERTRPASAWRQKAFFELPDGRSATYAITSAMTRIGRETDNDLRLTDPTVHRYHAVLEQTPEAEYIISYVGDPDYDGLRVDGLATQRHRLRGGEVLEIGAIKLRFALSPA